MKLPSRKTLAAWLFAWATLSAAGAWLHITFWINGPYSEGPLASLWVRRVFNFVFLPSTPFSLVALIGLDNWGPRPMWQAVALHAVTWAFWLTVLFVVIWWWKRARGSTIATGTTPPPSPHSPARRRFIADAAFGTAGVAGAAGWGLATASRPWDFEINRYTIPVKNLPEQLSGLRIVQISDTHLGPRIPAEYVRRVVAAAVAEAPDLFILSGDYVHNGPMYIAPAADLFKPLTATGKPVVGTLGNHDWYADGNAMSRALEAIGVRMLDNRHTYLSAATRWLVNTPDAGPVLCLAGLGDLKTDVIDPKSALAGVPDDMCRVVISHNPDSAERTQVTRGPRIDLMISGHFHGGQIKLPFLGNPFMKSEHGEKYLMGVVQGPACPVFVSKGLGMSVLPIRINCPPELAVLTLIRG